MKLAVPVTKIRPASECLILGLNTRVELSGRQDGHDPAACLWLDGVMLCCVEEERFTRRRFASGIYPRLSTAWCLAQQAATLDDVDVIAVGWNPRRQVDYEGPTRDSDWLEAVLPKRIFPRNRDPALEFVDHHLAHAAGALHSSPFDTDGVLVLDGAGERESISLWTVADGELRQRQSLPISHSLGFMYQAMSEHVGLGSMGAGKAMGLAPWGRVRYDVPSPLADPPAVAVSLPTIADNGRVVGAWRALFDKWGVSAPAGPEWDPLRLEWISSGHLRAEHRDLAASVQSRLEMDVVELVDGAVASFGLRNIALSGGVALNCKANGNLVRSFPNLGLFVQPSSNDAGVAIGAAAFVADRIGTVRRASANEVRTGPSFDMHQVTEVLRECGVRYRESQDPAADAASRLAQGEVIAWFQGRAEVGPRALGSRSLLADPSRPQMLERVNRIKRREAWRPLAPSIAEKHLGLLSVSTHGDPRTYHHMLVTCDVDGPASDRLRAVTHVDGSSRPQVVPTGGDPRFERLLELFETQTGTPAVINTSFNVEAPIVNTPEQAVATFFTSDIDTLIMEDCIVTKNSRW